MSKNAVVRALALAVGLGVIAVIAHALDYPHNDYINNIECDSCHDVHSGTFDLLPQEYDTPPQNIDDTQANNLCWSCHNDVVAPYVKTHSSLTTDNDYGDWAVECKTCHDPHQQMQFRQYGSESYLYSGTVSLVTSTTLTVDNAGWTSDQYKGLVVIPNISQDYYNYKVTGNTTDTLTVEGPMDLNKVTGGDTLAIVYEKLIESTIPTPNSGDKTVKFFRDLGANSFADGDTTYNGVCEVCHTQTAYHRNNADGDHAHNLGMKCTQCHQHVNGFAGMGGGAHQVHVAADYGPQLTCAGGNLGCHGTNAAPLLADGQNLANTTVCNDCHSSDGVANAKQYWGNPGSSEGTTGSWAVVEGEASFCGSCHDAAPGNTKMDGSGDNASNVMGDRSTYGFSVTGHGKPSGSYAKLSWEDASASGNPAANKQCSSCHELTSLHFNSSADRLKSGYENDANNSNCKQCHPPGTEAVADPQFYTTYGAYQNSAHSSKKCTACHDVHGVAGAFAGMTTASQESLCYQCHTEGVVQNDALANNRPGGYVSADDIQEAFGKSEKHNLGTSFTLNGNTYTLECISCHNIHLVNGKYWDAEAGDRTPVTRFPPGSANNLQPWGDEPGEKMDDFAALGVGTGGWYYSVARGGALIFDQPAVYQPPKAGSDYNFEFDGDVLPDYDTFCLDCHTYRMSDANPPVNWGQGIGCTDNSVDPPNQRIECGAQHGLGAANKPSYISDSGTAGLWGSSGNADVLFHMNYVTRGRHNGHFMRWPYETADRAAGINFVMACTDCHEAHGSNRGSMIRERVNVNSNGDCGTGGDTNPNGENCSDGGNWNSFCNVCHYYYGGNHAGMSCGNASCHEANSVHRIIHVTHSGGTQLTLTAAGYESDYQRPDFTPEIDTVEGHIGSNELAVTFRASQGTVGIYTNSDLTGAVVPGDFWLFDINSDNSKTITNVTHTAGAYTATITMSAPLIAADLNNDILATRGKSIWDWYEGGYENWATGTISAQAVSAGPWPVTITGPPPVQITSVIGSDGFFRLLMTFSEPVYAGTGQSGALKPSDFVVTDVGGNNSRTIIDVDHSAGATSAILTMDAPLVAADIDVDTIAAVSNSIYDAYDNPMGTGAVTISGSDCPVWGTSFQFDELAGSALITDEVALLVGTVGNPTVAIQGDGYFHGDESQGTWVDVDSNNTCLLSTRALTIEARVKPNAVDLDWEDDGNGGDNIPGRVSTFNRIFDRKRSIKITIMRADYGGDNVPARDGKARVQVKYFVDSASRHTCPHSQWPDDTYAGNDARWHQINTDIVQWPIVNDHWYKIKVVFNSDKSSGVPGSNGTPVDIFVDDQGPNGDDVGESWSGYVNASATINESSSCKWGALPGDFIASENQYTYIGSPPKHDTCATPDPVSCNALFKGLIDWVIWKPIADYSGVDEPPH